MYKRALVSPYVQEGAARGGYLGGQPRAELRRDLRFVAASAQRKRIPREIRKALGDEGAAEDLRNTSSSVRVSKAR